MPLPFRKASDVPNIAPSFMFIGPIGTGKSSLLGQAAKYLSAKRAGKFAVLNMEPRMKSATPELATSGADILDQPSWVDIMQYFTAEYRNYPAGTGIDGFDGYARACFYDICGVTKKSEKEWMSVGQEFLGNQNIWHIFIERMLNHMRILVEREIPLIVTGHVKFDKDELSGEIYKSVNTWGKTAVNIPALFTVCGILDYVKAATEIWEVKFRPERGFPARDTLGRLPAKMDITIKPDRNVFGNIWETLMPPAPPPAAAMPSGKPTLAAA